MIYTMNGMATELNLQADQPGTFRGLSAHFSGDGFSDMHFDGARRARRTSSPPGSRATRGAGPRARRAPPTTRSREQSIDLPPVDLRQRSTPGLFAEIVDAGARARPGPGTEPRRRRAAGTAGQSAMTCSAS